MTAVAFGPKVFFKNSYLRLLKTVNAVVALIASRPDRLTEIFFFKLKLFILGHDDNCE